TLTILATGSILVDGAVVDRARTDAGSPTGDRYDFRPMLGAIRGYTAAADLAICRLEQPLLAGLRRRPEQFADPSPGTPDELADALGDAGYDSCATASDDIYDQGPAGVRATLNALDRDGIGHSGSARTPNESTAIELHTVRGALVALLSYTAGNGRQ